MTVRRTKGSWRLFMALLLSLAVVAAACGSDSDDDDAASATEPPSTDDAGTGNEPSDGEDPYEGCDDAAVTDVSEISVGREPARCEPGYPKAVPLDETTQITVTAPFKLEFIAPILLADHFGEFEAENLEFELVQLPFPDAIQALRTGDVDMTWGGPEAAYWNTVAGEFEITWSAGNFYPPNAGDLDTPQTGLWARRDVFEDPDNPDFEDLKGTSLGTTGFGGNTTSYPIAEAFTANGISIGDVDVQTIPGADLAQALENNAVQSAWMIDPFWQQLVDSGDYVLLATQTPGEPIGGMFAGPTCHADKHDACVAFLRAMIRTINTYLDGDYKQDEEIVQAIAEVTDADVESIRATPPMLFDWEIREGTATRIIETFISFAEFGDPVVEFDEPLPESEVVDRSFYLEAIGQG